MPKNSDEAKGDPSGESVWGTKFQQIKYLFEPHIESFNYFLGNGTKAAISNLPEIHVEDRTGQQPGPLRFGVDQIFFYKPLRSDKRDAPGDVELLPRECRLRGLTYRGRVEAVIHVIYPDGREESIKRSLGHIPIMVKSDKCWLANKKPVELANLHEEAYETGGYFIVNGLERLIRLIQVPRRNYPLALVRGSYPKRGPEFTKFGVQMRCVRADQTSSTITLHYLSSGAATLRCLIRRQEFFIPVVLLLKALVDCTDLEIYEQLVRGNTANTFLANSAEVLIRDAATYLLYSRQQIKAFLGSKFRVVLDVPSTVPDEDVATTLINTYICVHLDNSRHKFNAIMLMIHKLLALARGDIQEDNPDSLSNLDALLGGHLYLMYFKEKLSDWLNGVKGWILKDVANSATKVDFNDGALFRKSLERNSVDIDRRMESFLSTGNLISRFGMDLMQMSGYTILADRLNFYRYLSHFRCIHRGAFFAQMKTTSVRKLLPDSWGFLCPVHTPDGAPCGLLNHLTIVCKIVTRDESDQHAEIVATLCGHGMLPSEVGVVPPYTHLPVVLDGNVVGSISAVRAEQLAQQLRLLKIKGSRGIPDVLEIAHIPPVPHGQFAGVFLFAAPGRFMRPVMHLASRKHEYIGSLEQVYMSIACMGSEVRAGRDTHAELLPTNMLSVVANLTPFSDFNQSPRNMYQCQMGKQTMGTPCYNYAARTDNKLYRLNTPQAPIVRTDTYDQLALDAFPTGTNAVVAVISYTGYDMEDAMILNKSAYERGFGAGTVYTYAEVDLDEHKDKYTTQRRFGNIHPSTGDRVSPDLDDDGLPHIGKLLRHGDPLYCEVDDTAKKARVESYSYSEPAHVDSVSLLASSDGQLRKIGIKLRYKRNPIIGDKFSSRHGQKGVLSILWPDHDMPFSESGIRPDVIINPNAFPSRMTIGMLVESMAGKSGAHYGTFHDATPFQFDEKERAVDYFGAQLAAAGYQRLGNETMYSGITGLPFNADIYLGVVYYQRLRHMVSDKYQVRATGPVNELTHQPLKGRKVGGGIRLGEMERDSLLAHGCSFLLFDRLQRCSDESTGYVCSKCASILPVIRTGGPETRASVAASMAVPGAGAPRNYKCIACDDEHSVRRINMPFVLQYLINELAAANIDISLDT